MALVNHNGELLDAHSPILGIENRSFRYGDGLFESMRVVDGQVMMLSRHLNRLMTGMSVLKLKADSDFSVEVWNDKIIKLCEENNCLDRARIRLTLYREAGGHYTPTISNIGYLIEAEKNETVFSNVDAKSLELGLFEEIRKPVNALGGVKTANSLIYVLAGLAKEKAGLDDMVILNESGRVAEVISSNIFTVTNGSVKTPDLDEGCVAGVTRDWLVAKIRELGIEVTETKLRLDDVHAAEEVFVTNAIQGIRRVSRFGESVYSHTLIQELCQLKPEVDL